MRLTAFIHVLGIFTSVVLFDYPFVLMYCRQDLGIPVDYGCVIIGVVMFSIIAVLWAFLVIELDDFED